MSASHAKLGRSLTATSLALVLSLGLAGSANATLGGDVASVKANQEHLGASRQIAKLISGERHDLVLVSGTVVHEYVSATGAVYAVTWQGPRIPDLRELLGPSFAQLEGGNVHRNGIHRMSLSSSDLEIRSMGRRGGFAGRAWIPSLVPAGVHPEASLDETGAR
jgi:hypothetical protein